jgi:hypothetical protein
MEFIENVDVKSCKWLVDQIKEDGDFLSTCVAAGEFDQYKKTGVLKTLFNLIKSGGSTKTKYVKKDSSGILRDYGGGVQSLPSKIRGLICKHMTDVDMQNCQPSILNNLCKKHEISANYLNEYVTNRDKIFEKYGKTIKQEVIRSMNKSTHIKAVGWLESFDKEMKRIQKEFVALPEYQVHLDMAKQKPGNVNGRFMAYLATSYEVKILHEVIAAPKVQIGVLMFDGFMFYGEPPENYLTYLSELVKKNLGMDIVWTYKEHDKTLQVPEDYNPSVEKDPETIFSDMAEEFEKNHCLIREEGVYVRHGINKTSMLSYKQLTDSYRHMVSGYVKTMGGDRPVNFIKKWADNNPSIRMYRTLGVYPNPDLCPNDCFNMWTDFAITQHDNYKKSEAAIERFVDLVDILSGHQPTTREYMLDWIAHIFQYPEQKTTMPTIVSAEGAGKGTLMDILTGMMGQNKVYQTTTPSREVFGNFNGPMSDAFLVNLNEVSASEMKGSSGKLKALITDNQMTINEKGVKQVQITSYAKFIVTTNNDEAIKPTRGDRRNILMYAADDLIKVGMNEAHIANANEKIKALREIIDSKDSLRSIYDFLMEREGLDGFGSKPPPMTQFQEEQQLLTMSAIEVWLRSWVVTQEGAEVTMTSAKCYETFVAWTKLNMAEYTCTSMQFGVRLTRLKIKGITSIRNKTSDKTFNINDMFEHFGISRD